MADPSLYLTCPKCNNWYSDKTVPHSELREALDGFIGSLHFCNCLDYHGNRFILIDAHARGLRTPVMQERYEELQQERDRVVRRLRGIDRELEELEE